MNVETAAADRLPWLPDEPTPILATPRRVGLMPWAIAIVMIVAAAAFWMGVRSVRQQPVLPVTHAPSSATLSLPRASPIGSVEVRIPRQAEVRPAPAPDVRPAPTRDVPLAVPTVHRSVRTASRPIPRSQPLEPAEPVQSAALAAQPSAPSAQPVAQPVPFVIPKLWNPRVVTGAAGRLVQIGAFGSVHQAKRGWWFMVHEYPAMAHLPAVVRVTRNSRRRAFYRFDVGTTSQAHSEILCQRMEHIRLSCAVIGLPWKAKVER